MPDHILLAAPLMQTYMRAHAAALNESTKVPNVGKQKELVKVIEKTKREDYPDLAGTQQNTTRRQLHSSLVADTSEDSTACAPPDRREGST